MGQPHCGFCHLEQRNSASPDPVEGIDIVGEQITTPELTEVEYRRLGAHQTVNADGARRLRSLLVNSLHNEMRLGNLAKNMADLSLRPEEGIRSKGDVADEDGDDVDSVRRTLSHEDHRNHSTRPGYMGRQQSARQQRAGNKWLANPAFVASTRYGTSHNSSNLRRMITAICEHAAVDRIVPYELHHTAISFRCDAGHDTVEVVDWAGTSARMIEEIYRHRLHDVSKLSSAVVADLEP